jgi:glycosyltransferase involved in cell wall biosynthesis
MIERLGLQGRIFQTPQYVNYMYGLTSQRMNQLYNSFDIHFSATGGEGFGLSTVESQAAGLPNVITDYTTSKELVQDHGELVKVETFEVCGAGVDRALIDMNDAAERILKLKNDSELRRKYSLAAREHMLCEYNWAGIGKAFNSYLTKMLA